MPQLERIRRPLESAAIVRLGAHTRRVTTVPNWIAVLGLIVAPGDGPLGLHPAGRNERARDERVAARDAIARRASVRERLEEQSHAFQRETLLELQDVLQRLMRSTAKIILHDEKTLKEQGKLTLVGEELDQESYQIGVLTRRVQERLLNPALRNAVEQFRGHVSEVEASVVVVDDMHREDAIKHLGGQLRTLSDITASSASWLAPRCA